MLMTPHRYFDRNKWIDRLKNMLKHMFLHRNTNRFLDKSFHMLFRR
jgi:hypothetical protein